MSFYFDHNASTPVDPQVLAAFVETAGGVHGNASSVHRFGQAAKQRLEAARRSVSALLGATPREIVFTSGGTEANNLAIFGAARDRHLVTTAIEHPSVLDACKHLNATFVPVGRSGVVDPDDVRRAIRRSIKHDTALVSVMHANNETGAIQPIAEIAAIAHEAGALMHSDGVQAAGRIACNVRELGVDLYTISAHKMNAPKGAGALFVRERTALDQTFFGGHQERERRPGTENVPAIVAFGVAASLKRTHDSALRDRLEAGILASCPGARVNAPGSLRLPNTTNICFPGLSGEALVIALDLDGFAISSGAACASGSIEPSHVLLAMGLTEADARSSVRISLGSGNTVEQINQLINAVAAKQAVYA